MLTPDGPTNGNCRPHLYVGITHPNMTMGLRILPGGSALEDQELHELPHPDPATLWAPPVPPLGALTHLSLEAGSAPETQALQGSGLDVVGQVQGWTLTCQQLWALLLKRFLLASLWPNSNA